MEVLLSPEEMATVTGGIWENLTPDTKIERVEYIFHYLTKNDLFVVHHSTCHKIKGALKYGVSALIIPDDCKVDVPIPVLRVENSYMALRAIALEGSERSRAKRVLVTGSYGKTGFKNHLYTVISDQLNTYAKLTSANHVEATYCNLASLKPEHELLIIEQPVSTKTKTKRRARYVHPDICVITSIGHEHIERFHTVDNIIENKTQIANALKKGGKFLIPKDDPYYKQLKRELQKYDHFDLLTFGSSRTCNAQLLYKKYNNFGWDVIAKIEEIVVAYRVPFPEIHEPEASLAVLLSVYHLGGDVRAAAAKFYSCSNFKSSGKIYEVNCHGKHFYLYDQSYRGGIEGYQSFFKSLRDFNPPNGGKKVLLTSEFVDYEDGEMALIDNELFQKLIAESGIESLFTVEKFTEHINVLPDKTIWKNHSLDFNNIKEEVLDSVDENDILCIKGIFESNLPQFTIWMNQLEGMEISELRLDDTTENLQKSLNDLRPISMTDKEHFYKAVEQAQKSTWVAYFPFLLTWAASANREVLLSDDHGSISVYLLRNLRRDTLPTLELFMAPMPLNEVAINSAVQRLFKYNGSPNGKVMWLEEKEMTMIQEWPISKEMIFKDHDLDEFLYDPTIYESLSGTKLRHLRHDINLIKKNVDTSVVTYTDQYKEECLELLKEWENTQGKKYASLGDTTYTRHCLNMADEFDKVELFGLIILINGKVRSFGFAGKITENTGALFVGKSDHSIKGLHSYLRYEILKKMSHYKFVNDSYAIGEGMSFSKRMFRPVKMAKQFKAHIGEKR